MAVDGSDASARRAQLIQADLQGCTRPKRLYPLAELVSDPIVNSKIRYDARTVGPMSKRPARAAVRKAYWNIPFDTLKALESSHAAFCLSSARVPQSNLMR